MKILFFLLSFSLYAHIHFTADSNIFDINVDINFLKNGAVQVDYTQIEDSYFPAPMLLESELVRTTPLTQVENDDFIEITHTDLIVIFNKQNLCVEIQNSESIYLAHFCPQELSSFWKGFSLSTQPSRRLYGLGQYFTNPGSADGDWRGRVWDPLYDREGNALRDFQGGANSFALFPVLYGLNSTSNFMLVYNNSYKQMWDFSTLPYQVRSYGNSVSFLVYSGQDPMMLRQKLMKLTGLPPLPPKRAFGHWVSEFGYESWDEVETEYLKLKEKQFPIDGMALDLQWFGGEFFMGDVDRTGSKFGTLRFDLENFPDPQGKIQFFKNEGIELMPIEESYISKWLPEHTDLALNRYMAFNCQDNSPVELTSNPWWGIGGMIDWSNPAAGLYWHRLKRAPLTELGLRFHWTDLGEPEMYDRKACYFGLNNGLNTRHADIHNVYNLFWLRSIAEGYGETHPHLRHFAMSRSGNLGVQRYGAGMWSGDIAANMGALTAHYNTQMHMSLSGVDYYGGDIGGFHRRVDTLDGDQDELYTQWFANAALFDFPIRSHSWNLSNQLETNPVSIGHFESNLFNIKRRYQLFPYYYSLAYQASTQGTPLIPAMEFVFPQDESVQSMGNQKMIGPYLMAAMVARYGERERSVYFPQGSWINFETNELIQSQGKSVEAQQAFEGDIFKLPLYIYEGAIIPLGNSDVMNITQVNLEKILIHPSSTKTSFTIYNDDGDTKNHLNGDFDFITVTQEIRATGVVIEFTDLRVTGHLPLSFNLEVLNHSGSITLPEYCEISTRMAKKTLATCLL